VKELRKERKLCKDERNITAYKALTDTMLNEEKENVTEN
jgi:hypothetical protein